MHYIGPVLQRLWAEEQPSRSRVRRPRRAEGEPGPVGRRTAPKRRQSD